MAVAWAGAGSEIIVKAGAENKWFRLRNTCFYVPQFFFVSSWVVAIARLLVRRKTYRRSVWEMTIQYTYCISLWCWFSFCSFYSSVKEPKLCFLETRLTCIFLGFQVRLRLRRERVQRAGVQVYRPSPRTVNIRRRDGHLLCLWTGTRFWFLTAIFSDIDLIFETPIMLNFNIYLKKK